MVFKILSIMQDPFESNSFNSLHLFFSTALFSFRDDVNARSMLYISCINKRVACP